MLPAGIATAYIVTDQVTGQQNPATASNDYNTFAFVVQQLLQKMQTVTLVRVVAVSNAGGVDPVGTVDVQPLVNQMSGDRIPTPHGIIYNVPYFRLQGGTNAVILDPQVGDIGMCGFASRDISTVKATKDQANPGSFRQYDWADGLYFGGMLNGTPEQYVRFSDSSVEIVSPIGVRIQAPSIELDGPVTATDTITATGDVTGAGVSLETHVHGGVTPGGGNTGPPAA